MSSVFSGRAAQSYENDIRDCLQSTGGNSNNLFSESKEVNKVGVVEVDEEILFECSQKIEKTSYNSYGKLTQIIDEILLMLEDNGCFYSSSINPPLIKILKMVRDSFPEYQSLDQEIANIIKQYIEVIDECDN